MSSIFPDDPKAGGLPIRDGAGNPVSQVGVDQAYRPAPAFVSTCPITALPSNCDARIEPKQINAIVSELVALAECWDANGPWDCTSLTNLCRAFQQWASTTGGSGTGITDSDKGDIVVSGTGTTWQFDSAVVTAAGRALLDDANAAAQRVTLGAIGDAPNDGTLYGRQSSAWTAVVIPPSGISDAPVNGTLYGRKDAAWSAVVIPAAGIPDAPTDGALYGRMSGAWSPVVIPPSSGIGEAPNDGTGYVRKSLTWSAETSGLTDAPNDGQVYARQSLAWQEVPGIGGISPTEYTFSTTAGLPPSSGQLRINNVSQPAVTALYLHKVNAQTVDIANALRLIQAGNVLLIQDKTNSANYQYYTVTGALTEAATYFTVPVIRMSGGTPFTAGRVMVAAFGMGASPFPEAPIDGELYYRRGSTGTWVKATVSASAPSGGVDGDIWYQVP